MESPYRIRKTWAQKEGEYTNAFKYFDKDGDGCISVKQLEEVILLFCFFPVERSHSPRLHGNSFCQLWERNERVSR